MIETNRYVGVVFPMSMCVSEFELRITRDVREGGMWMDDVEEGRELREVIWLKTPFGREVSLLLLRE